VGGWALDVCDAVCDHEETGTEPGIEEGGWALEGGRQSLECDAVCHHVKSKPKDCPALSTGAIVGIVIACILVYFFVIKPKKAAVAPDRQAPQSPTSTNKRASKNLLTKNIK
jgi:hypothetical protein